jgi:predicted esterase
MPALIVVGIGNTDRTRDLTPSRAKVESYPTSGGGDKFLEFIQSELIPEIEKRYRTAPYRIFAGHSFGGLLAIHALITRPDLFNAYIAVSPSLQWDDGRTLHEAQQFFAKHGEIKKTLFFSLANEADKPNPMGENFEALRKTLEAGAPKGLRWTSARYPDEDHRSTVLLAHYAGMRTIFSGWNVVVDARTGLYGGGLTGIEQHYRELSERFGYPIVVPEMTINILGYQLLSLKRVPEAVAAFERYAQLYPDSANAYDSLGEGLEAAGKLEGAAQNFKKAIELGTKSNDESLPQFQQHLERVAKAAQAAEHPSGKK